MRCIVIDDEPTAQLALGGLDDKADVIEAFRRQADGYLVKPVSKARLGEAIGRLRGES
ncbi:MAG: DNA-binding NarL/FixJ family response regulator [Planctomycetota bacterium]|jgi:DNA-binding NarL/FixJ family response regulator